MTMNSAQSLELNEYIDNAFASPGDHLADLADATKHLQTLLSISTGTALEIRCIKDKVTGSFKITRENLDSDLPVILEEQNGKAQIYVTINGFGESKNPPVKDGDIKFRQWLAFDFDPDRAKKTASTNQELKRAEDAADELISFLGISKENYLRTMSGNGVFLLVAIEPTETTKGTNAAIKRLYGFLKERQESQFSDVIFDSSVCNPSRVMKLAGTISIKGDDTKDRPRRLCRLVSVPDNREPLALSRILDVIPSNWKPREEIEREERAAQRVINCEFSANKRPVEIREFPPIDFRGDRIATGGKCGCCGESAGLCLAGTSGGHSWGACWTTTAWDNLGEGGKDWLRLDTMGSDGSAFFWADGAPVIVRAEDLKAASSLSIKKWMENSMAEKDISTLIDGLDRVELLKPDSDPAVPQKIKAPVNFHLPTLRDGILKTAGLYFRQRYALVNSDGAALLAALALASLMARNRVVMEDYKGHRTRISLWTLLIGPSGSGKSSMFDEVEWLFNAMAENQIHGVSELSSSAFINSTLLHPDRMFLFRADEFKTFHSNKALNSLIPSMMSWKSGNRAANSFLNNSEKKNKTHSDINKSVTDFQFNIFAQTTKEWLFEDAETAHFTGGFFGRFLVVYDDDARAARGLEKNDPRVLERLCAETGGRIERNAVIESGKELMAKNGDVSTVRLEKAESIYLIVKLTEIFSSMPVEGDIQGALLSRLNSIILEVAALVEVSRGKAWGGMSPAISRETIDESISFVFEEFLKWFKAINANLFQTKTGKEIERARQWLKTHHAAKAKPYSGTDGDFTGITLRDFQRTLHFGSAGFALQIAQDLELDGTVIIHSVKVGKTNQLTTLISYQGEVER